jgi:glutathione S-transferase
MRLYVVHGSHPCAFEEAMSLKDLSYDVTEWPPTLHAPMQLALFGARTVPALKLDSEKISGSRAIMRRLDLLRPDPPLYPTDATARGRVEEAERWGDGVFQPIARELIWAGFTRSAGAMVSYGEHSRLPLPAPAIRAIAPAVARMGARLNRTNAGVARCLTDDRARRWPRRCFPIPTARCRRARCRPSDGFRRLTRRPDRAAYQRGEPAASSARRGLVRPMPRVRIDHPAFAGLRLDRVLGDQPPRGHGRRHAH